MKSTMGRCSALVAVLSFYAHAQAQVVLVGGSGGGALGEKLRLNNVGVQRGGLGDNFFYDYDDLIGVSLDEVNIPGASPTDLRTVLLYADPLDSNRGQAFTDQFVNTGSAGGDVVDHGQQAVSLKIAIEMRFA